MSRYPYPNAEAYKRELRTREVIRIFEEAVFRDMLDKSTKWTEPCGGPEPAPAPKPTFTQRIIDDTRRMLFR